MIEPEQITPYVNRDNAFFWEGTARHQLLLQKCDDCSAVRHPPAPVCSQCQSLRWAPVPASGRATLFSWIIPRYPLPDYIQQGAIVALVELAEGPRYLTNMVGDDSPVMGMHESPVIGMDLDLVFPGEPGEYQLPAFRAVTEARHRPNATPELRSVTR